MSAVLEVEDLVVNLPTDRGVVHAVRGVSFGVEGGKVLGVVGESGSGKSVTALAIMGLLPRSAQVTGSVRLNGEELLGKSSRQLARIRGKQVGMVFQDPIASLDPVYKVGWQMAEGIRRHQDVGRGTARRRVLDLLSDVAIGDGERRARSYPHELSGGMRQRVVIAMAIANDPGLLIADEPTTALDVTVQAQVLETLARVREERRSALLLITHDLGVVAGGADDVVVMYAGRIVERGPVTDVFTSPWMPYTAALLASVPRVSQRGAMPPGIPGSPPSSLIDHTGCPFLPRCPRAQALCASSEPSLDTMAPGREVACHFPVTPTAPPRQRRG